MLPALTPQEWARVRCTARAIPVWQPDLLAAYLSLLLNRQFTRDEALEIAAEHNRRFS